MSAWRSEKAAYGKWRDRVAEGGFSVTVLDGATGSSSFLSALFNHVRTRRLHTGATAGCPPLDDTMKLVKAISQSRGARLQDQG